MKVQKLTIHRIYVAMSCGCSVVCDFKDAAYKDPFKVIPTVLEAPAEGDKAPVAGPPEAFQELSFCDKHRGSKYRSMLEFVLSERMDEAIEEGQKVPVIP